MSELTPESMRQIEAAITAHRTALELAESRLRRIEQLEQELKLSNMELDRARIDIHDLKNSLRIAENVARAAIDARVAYETLVTMIARQLHEFTPISPMVLAYHRTAPPVTLKEDDATDGHGGGRERPASGGLPPPQDDGRGDGDPVSRDGRPHAGPEGRE